MKLTGIFMLVCCLQISAKSNSQNVTLKVRNAPLTKVFNEIRKQTGYTFIYTESMLREAKRVSVEITNSPLRDALTACLAGQPLSYQIINKTIVVQTKVTSPLIPAASSLTEMVSPPPVEIHGRVVDQQGNPLANVSVIISGTTVGTTTNSDGRFTITAPDNRNVTLEFSSVGYVAKKVSAGSQEEVNVVLDQDVSGLNEVVVVGYGTQKRNELTSAVVSFSDRDLDDVTENVGIDEALKGKASGVQVQQTTGQPGSAPQVRIRGVGSLTAGNSPLWVIDNIPTTDPDVIRNVDLTDVKSINILKGAAAAAIYGSRGSNGVIIIESKNGTQGKMRMSANYSQGWSKLAKKIDVLNGPEEAIFIKTARDNAWVADGGSLDDPMSARPYTRQYPVEWNDPNFVPETYDYQDFVFHTAPIRSMTVNASGGNENALFFVSGAYSDEEGVVKKSGFKHFSFLSNTDLKLTKFMTLKVSVNPSFTVTDRPDVAGPEKGYHRTILSTPYTFSPLSGVPGSGIPPITSGYFATPLFNLGVPNFLWLKDKMKGRMLQTSADLKIKILPELKYELFAGLVYNQNHRDIFSPLDITQVVNQNPNGSYAENRQNNYVFNHTISYDKTINQDHKFSVMAGYTTEIHNNFSSQITGLNFPTDLVETMNQALDIQASTLKNEWTLISFLGRINYNYKDRYLLNINFRRDGSSRFGKENKWGNFPSASGGWVISNESFFESQVINYLKVRGGYGFTGNNQIGDYTHIANMGINYAAFGNSESIQTGIFPSNPGNENLGWEKAGSFEIGFNASILKNRISVDFDYYRNITKSLLIDVGLPAHSGFLSQTMNLGKVLNKGTEIQINSDNLTNELKWTTSLNLSFNKNKVLKLGENDAPIFGPPGPRFSNITEVGYPIGSYYLLEQIGVWNTQDEIDKNPHWNGATPGSTRMLDWNGDGIVDLNDRHIITNAHPTPTYYFGITNRFRYKNFDFSFFINGAGGNKIMDGEAVTSAEGDSHTEHNGLWRDFWKGPDNPGNGKAGLPNDRLTGSEGQASTRSLVDGSFVQLNNLTLGYSFPLKSINTIGIEKVRFSISGNNLWIQDNAPYLFNVEGQTVNTGNALGGGGYANSTYPLARQIILNLNVIF